MVSKKDARCKNQFHRLCSQNHKLSIQAQVGTERGIERSEMHRPRWNQHARLQQLINDT